MSSPDPSPGSPDIERWRFFGLLQSGLDLLDQGMTVFDSELRLVAWNQAFFDLLEFPPDLARLGTPFEDFMRHNAARGEYGPGAVEDLVAERVRAAQAFTPHYTERVRPNGRVIAVRGEPLPGKGLITIYTDITVQRGYERMMQEQNTELEERVRERTADLLATNERLVQAQALLAQAQKMEAVGQLTGGVAHDFNNLLTVVIGNLDALSEQLHDRPEAGEHLAPALAAAHRGVDLVKRLLAFSKRQLIAPVCVDVNKTVDSVATLLRHFIPENIRLRVDLPEVALHAIADPAELESALLNLCLNARDAMPSGGELSIAVGPFTLDEASAGERSLAPGRYVQVAVHDGGTGMDARTADRAFEPFFTTKAFGAGNGLGLSMVYGFAKRACGDVRIASRPGAGTSVFILLPETEPQLAAHDSDRPGAAVPGERALVLVVEDDDDVRAVVRRQANSLGYPVIEARNGEEALGLIEGVGEIGIVLTDLVMTGGINGRELAARSRSTRPALGIVLMTGYDHRGGDEVPGSIVLSKPFTTADLARALAEATVH
ncbi:PAS-domain containing protein [Polaromonas sp.]|uniref:PAS-domain containing protein n=1 Tax=Polaromonas sp. TaxID=1869339 RepID=UPI002FC8146E